MSKKRKNIILLLMPIFLISLSLGMYIINVNQVEKINLALQKNLSNLEINYQMLMYNQKSRADSTIESLFHLETVKNIMIRANISEDKKSLAILRNNLHKILLRRYNILIKNGVLQFHIVLPNNKTFLRMHKPLKFDDDLTNIRKDMAWVNNTEKPLNGFNIGKTSHSFKNIIPLFYENKYYGLIDIAFTAQSVQDYLKNISKIRTDFLVHKDIFSQKSWEQDKVKMKYVQATEHKDYMRTLAQNEIKQNTNIKILESLKSKIEKKITGDDSFVLYNDISQTESNAIVYLPIRNTVTKKVQAWLVSYEVNENIKIYEQDKIIMMMILSLIFGLIFVFIYRIIIQKEILNDQVKQKTLKLSTINKKLSQSQKKLSDLNNSLLKIIDEEIEKVTLVQEKIFKVEQQSSMGEMISNIAHQWRQPLSIITSQSSSMLLQNECGLLEKKDLIKSCNSIILNSQYLSKTIDDFRNFIDDDQIKESFVLSSNMKSLLGLVNPIIKENNIKLITIFDDDIELVSYSNELNQCLINIINNAKDALLKIDEKNRYIFINTSIENNKVKIVVKDNGNGISEENLPKIFDPYFTTKHKAQGTGIGLNRTYNVINDYLHGSIIAQNTKYNYNGRTYTGAEFIITL